MSQLTIRKLVFDFSGVDFVWNPANPRFSIEMNKLSFFAVGLERYFCRAVLEAEPLITHPAAFLEARDFRAQESVHALVHRQHVKALCERYPGLEGTLKMLIAHFDGLYESMPLKFHLAYAGALESIFTPSFKLMLDYRGVLFSQGDVRVASMFLWHFCEEVEHRSAALDIYNHVVGNYWYRLKSLPQIARHIAEGMNLLTGEFRQHVPEVPAEYYSLPMYADVPKKAQLQSMAGIALSQLPWHHPSRHTLPAYFHEWKKCYDRGDDMTRAYGQAVRT